MTETGFHLAAADAHRLPGYYATDPDTGRLERRAVSDPEEWTRPPVFPSGGGGLLSTVDDLLVFARLLLGGGVYGGTRLLSERSVELMTTNYLTPEQITGGGMLLSGLGWGYGMAVSVEPDDVSATPGRYGWDGGYGTTWFNDPSRGLIAIALTQTTDFLFAGGRDEFQRLAAATAGDES
jgi:CubicO group peptidase (beta-lactamase class C family)